VYIGCTPFSVSSDVVRGDQYRPAPAGCFFAVTERNAPLTTFLYARVSTSEQTLNHQLTQARQVGYVIHDDNVIADHGVSGVSTKLFERENGELLFKLLRKGDVLVVRWLDRLGRNYQDVKEAFECLMKRGVIVKTIINGCTFDGYAARRTMPSGSETTCRCRDAVVGHAHVVSFPLGIVWSVTAPRGRRAGDRWGGSGCAFRVRMA
jgi:Resolvase, N terminal domain